MHLLFGGKRKCAVCFHEQMIIGRREINCSAGDLFFFIRLFHVDTAFGLQQFLEQVFIVFRTVLHDDDRQRITRRKFFEDSGKRGKSAGRSTDDDSIIFFFRAHDYLFFMNIFSLPSISPKCFLSEENKSDSLLPSPRNPSGQRLSWKRRITLSCRCWLK